MSSSPPGARGDGQIRPADEVEVDHGYDTEDSGFEQDSVLTQSVRSSIYQYKVENGRTYHAYKEGQYFMPNDSAEHERLELQHRAMFLAAGGQLFYAPVAELHHVLDLGTGIGTWAVEVADAHPEAVVIGVDLSPIQPSLAPPNTKWEIDDVEDDWTWPTDHFDLIYSQFMLSGSIADFPKYFRQAFRHCRPGGYFELRDLATYLRSDHVPIREDSAVDEWCRLMREGITGMGRRLDLDFEQLGDLMREVGFVEVVVRPFKIPIGRWPSDPKLKEAGLFQLYAMLEGVEALTLAIFTRCLNWEPERVQVFLADVRREFKATKRYTYWPSAVIYGKKPLSAS
ncbi:methyltransferase domain-containing protein [Cladophialophora carrionii]|uniref:Methyltransferase domain-containing protein n=1 Tax=Cladophialophora carrionii TaxID=86049 RepID=A0A1C1CMT5_9EURO|nr:methyltransferase domain-containing protein [Cladophialophora carrionii]